jgi:four helix bundle protein
MKTHKELDVWKDSVELVIDVYNFTKGFPKEELYGITNQIRRAVVSIPTNISEGSGRNYSAEFIRFLKISQGSLSEFETLLVISLRLNYLDEVRFKSTEGRIFKINAQLSGLIKSIHKGIQHNGAM